MFIILLYSAIAENSRAGTSPALASLNHILNRNDKSEHTTHLDNVVRIIIVWSEWRDLNSRPLDPQLRFDALHQIFYSSKSRFQKNAESLDTSMFFALLLYHTSAADTIFFVQFQKKKAHKSAQILMSVRFLCVNILSCLCCSCYISAAT